MKNVFCLLTMFGILSWSVVPADAQIAFGVTMQNGVVTGGGFQVGGFVTNGGTRVRMGVNVGTSQLVGLSNFMLPPVVMNGAGPGAVGNNQQAAPTPQQFVQAAGRFDRDHNGRLDRPELTQMASAVLKELRQRNVQIALARNDEPGPPVATTNAQMVETFVARCLSYDADKDEGLNSTETAKMAADLLRSLS